MSWSGAPVHGAWQWNAGLVPPRTSSAAGFFQSPPSRAIRSGFCPLTSSHPGRQLPVALTVLWWNAQPASFSAVQPSSFGPKELGPSRPGAAVGMGGGKVIISVSSKTKADRTARVAVRRAPESVHAGSPAFLSVPNLERALDKLIEVTDRDRGEAGQRQNGHAGEFLVRNRSFPRARPEPSCQH